MRIDLTRDQHKELTDLLSFAYRTNYYYDHSSETFDEMVDAVHDAQPTVGDF